MMKIKTESAKKSLTAGGPHIPPFCHNVKKIPASLPELLELNISRLHAKPTIALREDVSRNGLFVCFCFFPFQLSDRTTPACLFVRQQLIIYTHVVMLQSNTGLSDPSQHTEAQELRQPSIPVSLLIRCCFVHRQLKVTKSHC